MIDLRCSLLTVHPREWQVPRLSLSENESKLFHPLLSALVVNRFANRRPMEVLVTIQDVVTTVVSLVFMCISFARLQVVYCINAVIDRSCSLVKDSLLRVLRAFLDVYSCLLSKMLNWPQKGKVPPIIDRLLLQSAQDLTAQIKTGKLKSEVLVKAYIDRIKTVNPHINAMVDQRFAEAVLEAIEVDRRVQHELFGNDPLVPNHSIHNQPLLGIPFSVKDSVSVEGMAFDGGLEERKGIKAKTTSKVVQLLRDSGAIPLVMTNIPEITMWWGTFNKIYGQTNNPYDLSRIPGGSSGGEGALISSAGSVIGIGTDIGGSIRIPSFCCGIFGHKPTPGLVPTDNLYPPTTQEKVPFQCVGPMTRYASDLLPVFRVMAEPNAHKIKNNQPIDLSKVKIYYMSESGNPFETPVSSEIIQSMDKTILYMTQKYGNYTQSVNLKKMKDGFLIWVYALMQARVPSLEKELSNTSTPINLFLEFIKYFLNQSQHTLTLLLMALLFRLLPDVKSDFGLKYVRSGRELKQELKQLLGKDGVLLYPTHPEPAPRHLASFFKITNCSYTTVFNVMGFPVTACPLGLTTKGLPIGVQVIGSPFNDYLTIAVATELEKAFGGWVSPSRISC